MREFTLASETIHMLAHIPVEDGNNDEATGVLGEGPGIGHHSSHHVGGGDDIQWACTSR